MPMPLYNAASDIIAAFQQGLMERRQKEQDLLNQQNKDRAFQEDQRQFNEKQKQEAEQQKALVDYHNKQLDLQKVLRDVGIAELRIKGLESMSRYGTVPRESNPLYGKSFFAGQEPTQIPESYNPYPNIEGFTPYSRSEMEAAQTYKDPGEIAALRAFEASKQAEMNWQKRFELQTQAEEARAKRDRENNAADLNRVLAVVAAKNGNENSSPAAMVGQDDAIDNQYLIGQRTSENIINDVPLKQRGQSISTLHKKGIIPLTKQQVAAIDSLEEASSIMDDIVAMRKSMSASSGVNIFSEYKSKRQQVIARIGKLRDSLGGKALGVLSNYDLARLEGAMPETLDLFRESKGFKNAADAKINSLLKMHNDAADRLLRNMPERQRVYFEANRRMYVK